MKIYLIRHAQSHPSVNLHYSKWPLSHVGERQAIKLPDILKPLGIKHIYSSPFLRCIQTVEPYAKKFGIDITIKNHLRERLVSESLIDGFYDVWRKSWEDFSFALPNCESSYEAQNRFIVEMREILNENKENTIRVSTHGNVIALFLKYLENGFSREQAENLKNPDVLRVTYDGEKLIWDKDFDLPGITEISTEHDDTPVDYS